jgi:hypothetical protein
VSSGKANSDKPTASAPQACENLELTVMLALHCLAVLQSTLCVPSASCGYAAL